MRGFYNEGREGEVRIQIADFSTDKLYFFRKECSQMYEITFCVIGLRLVFLSDPFLLALYYIFPLSISVSGLEFHFEQRSASLEFQEDVIICKKKSEMTKWWKIQAYI